MLKEKNLINIMDTLFSLESLNNFDQKLKFKIKRELKVCKNSEKRQKAKNYKEYVNALIGPTLRKMFFEKYPKNLGN